MIPLTRNFPGPLPVIDKNTKVTSVSSLDNMTSLDFVPIALIYTLTEKFILIKTQDEIYVIENNYQC